MQDLIIDLDLAIKVAYQAGELAKGFQENGFEVLKDKEEGDPHLTNADMAIDSFIFHRLLEQTPSYGWFSEESGSENITKNKERVWVVDPIDGTDGFIKQNDNFAISIALLDNNYPMLGVIYNPMKDQMFYCLRGHGVFLNDQQMVRDIQEIEDSFVLLPTATKKLPYSQSLIKKTGQFEEVGSIAYRMALIAAGQADISFTDHELSLWDIAAGVVMLEEQNINTKDLNGDDIIYSFTEQPVKHGVISCCEHVFEDVHNSLKSAIKD